VLLNDIYTAVSVIGARGAARSGVPYVLQPLGTLSPAPERGRPLAKRAFLALWGNRTLADATALIYSSDDERRDFLEAGADAKRLLRLPLPLDLPLFDGTTESSEPTVAYVGRLHPIKRIDRLIEAVAIARRQIPNLRLEIVGPGDRHGRELQELARQLELGDAVRFHGFVAIEEKLRILARAHVSALLSASEGLPIAALEAMACGTPVVLSAGCHLPEVHDRGGLVVPGSAEEAATALVELLGDDARRARLGAGARTFAAEFRRELVMPRMLAAFEALAEGRSALEAQALGS
jgi:glycosyltransferase involved in cell wall biosynthesis